MNPKFLIGSARCFLAPHKGESGGGSEKPPVAEVPPTLEQKLEAETASKLKLEGELKSEKDAREKFEGELKSEKDARTKLEGELKSERDKGVKLEGELKSERDKGVKLEGELKSEKDARSKADSRVKHLEGLVGVRGLDPDQAAPEIPEPASGGREALIKQYNGIQNAAARAEFYKAHEQEMFG